MFKILSCCRVGGFHRKTYRKRNRRAEYLLEALLFISVVRRVKGYIVFVAMYIKGRRSKVFKFDKAMSGKGPQHS